MKLWSKPELETSKLLLRVHHEVAYKSIVSSRMPKIVGMFFSMQGRIIAIRSLKHPLKKILRIVVDNHLSYNRLYFKKYQEPALTLSFLFLQVHLYWVRGSNS
jgi:hypothetical protein